MYCTRCGIENPDTAFRCSSCDDPLSPPMTNASAPGMHPSGSQAPNYLVWSILVTLFCCQPFGIVGIVFSALAMGHNSSGRYAEAHRSADMAKKWNGWGVVAWLVAVAFCVVFMVIMMLFTAAGP